MPPVEQVSERNRSSKTHSLGGNKFFWDGTIGSVHYWEDEQWKEIDNYFEPAVAPWDWQMLKAGYHIRVKENFTAGQVIEFEKQGETVHFQPMALEWTNNLDQVQPISVSADVTPTITNPEVDLLPAVGIPSHQGTIRWDNAYGEGLDFEWRCTPTRLVKILEIESLNKLPTPEQYILDGGNPVLRLNLIFDPSKHVDIYIDGAKWNKATKKQTFNVIEFRKDGEVLWGFMPLRYWGSYEGEDDEFLKANDGRSVATLDKKSNDLYISIRVPYEWLQVATYPIFVDATVEYDVNADANDIDIEDTTGDTTRSYAGWRDGTGSTHRQNGYRFTGVTIPDGSIASSSTYMTLIAYDTRSGEYTNQPKILGEDAADPGEFSTYADWNGRTETTAEVGWDIPDITGLESYNTPDLSSIVNELLTSYSYASGAAMVFLGKVASGGAARKKYFCCHPATAPGYDPAHLHIEYTAGGPTPNQFNKLVYTSEPPTANAWNQVKQDAGTGWKKLLYV